MVLRTCSILCPFVFFVMCLDRFSSLSLLPSIFTWLQEVSIRILREIPHFEKLDSCCSVYWLLWRTPCSLPHTWHTWSFMSLVSTSSPYGLLKKAAIFRPPASFGSVCPINRAVSSSWLIWSAIFYGSECQVRFQYNRWEGRWKTSSWGGDHLPPRSQWIGLVP